MKGDFLQAPLNGFTQNPAQTGGSNDPVAQPRPRSLRMKIIHVIATLDPAAGGPASVAIRLAAAQAGLGNEVHILSYGDEESERRARESAESIPHLTDVHLHRIHPAGILERLVGSRACRLFDRLSADAHFVHAHGLWETFIWRTLRMAHLRGVPYCVRPAGMLDRWSMDQKKWKKRLALVFTQKRMLDRAAFIHLLNQDEIGEMTPLSLRAPIRVIPNGVFLEEVEALAASGGFREKLAKLGQRRFILFLSRLHYKKGLDILAEAFELISRKVPDVDLVVAGPDYGARDSFVKAVEAKGLGGRIHVVGPLYGRDKYAALGDAACFCLPSRQEGFSVAILEALACGVPVVVSQPCHFPEIGGAGAGIVTSLRPAEVAVGVLEILESPKKAAGMAAKAKQLVEKSYTWQSIALRTIEAYALVLGLDEIVSKLPPF
jgi:glycosyltransferase involved in cell wall biosynthesis